MINVYIITMMENADSLLGARRCLKSFIQGSTIGAAKMFISPAAVPEQSGGYTWDTIAGIEKELGISADRFIEVNRLNNNHTWHPRFTWPDPKIEPAGRFDLTTGLFLKPYNQPETRITVMCTMSHVALWLQCIREDRPIIILEHDAYLRSTFTLQDIAEIEEHKVKLCSLNSPVSQNGVVTRKGRLYHELVQKQDGKYVSVPTINTGDDPPLPQGLPGNSAYYITPWAAEQLIRKMAEIGIWPNDALMCKEFFPWLKVAKHYFTDIQKMRSTTTGVKYK